MQEEASIIFIRILQVQCEIAKLSRCVGVGSGLEIDRETITAIGNTASGNTSLHTDDVSCVKSGSDAIVNSPYVNLLLKEFCTCGKSLKFINISKVL